MMQSMLFSYLFEKVFHFWVIKVDTVYINITKNTAIILRYLDYGFSYITQRYFNKEP